MLEAVQQDGFALEYALDDLNADQEVVLEAVKQNGFALRGASDDLKAEREVVLEAVKQTGRALQYASNDLRGDPVVVLEAVKQDGWALQGASDALRCDREIVLEAVKQKGRALEYALDDLNADREVVLEAVKQTGAALEYAANNLNADREVVLEAVKQEGFALQCASDDLKSNREVVLEAVKQTGGALKYASEALQADRDFVLEAVKQDGFALLYASNDLKADINLRKAAELNGYRSNPCLIAEDIRNIYSNPQKLLEQISVIEDEEIKEEEIEDEETNDSLITDDPLISLCHFDSQESHEEKFALLKVLLPNRDLIPHLAQRVACIQNTFSMQHDACLIALGRCSPDDALMEELIALNKACNHIDNVFLNYQAYSELGKQDTFLCEKIITLIQMMYGTPIIAQDAVLSLLELPADAGEKSIIEAFSKQDYNALVQKITTQKIPQTPSSEAASSSSLFSPNTTSISAEGDEGRGMAPTQSLS
jgi:uncharacterized protein YcgL (UPF0745 family)